MVNISFYVVVKKPFAGGSSGSLKQSPQHSDEHNRPSDRVLMETPVIKEKR
jgi:hypothetical protein